jgi:DNA-binding LytR/AlgR family response regulator
MSTPPPDRRARGARETPEASGGRLLFTAEAEAPLRVLVADDEAAARRRTVHLLQAMPGVALVGEYELGTEALEAARALRPDVAFLDVVMPGMDGLDVARRLAAESDGGPLIVFVTEDDEHALAAFDVHALDYVVKPLDGGRLRDAVSHARRMLGRARADARIGLRDGRRLHLVSVADVLWVESLGNYVRVHTPRSRHIHRGTMHQVARELASYGFVRIHRSAIVNARRIVQLRPRGHGRTEAHLDTGLRLRVSRTFRSDVEAIGA